MSSAVAVLFIAPTLYFVALHVAECARRNRVWSSLTHGCSGERLKRTGCAGRSCLPSEYAVVLSPLQHPRPLLQYALCCNMLCVATCCNDMRRHFRPNIMLPCASIDRMRHRFRLGLTFWSCDLPQCGISTAMSSPCALQVLDRMQRTLGADAVPTITVSVNHALCLSRDGHHREVTCTSDTPEPLPEAATVL